MSKIISFYHLRSQICALRSCDKRYSEKFNRQPSSDLTFNCQPSKRLIFNRQPSKGSPPIVTLLNVSRLLNYPKVVQFVISMNSVIVYKCNWISNMKRFHLLQRFKCIFNMYFISVW